MNEPNAWIGRLEAEISGDLGQPVTLAMGGELPEPSGCFADVLDVPGARLVLAGDGDDTAAFLAEARVIEAGQLDRAMVRELWSGILASIASRLGGKASPAPGPDPSGQPCLLRLGGAGLRMSLAVEAIAGTGIAAGVAASPAAGAGGRVPAPQGNFDLLLEVELDASVRFGSREIELKELLELGPGDVVELDRQVADPVDLVVGDRIVARGEVVLVNGNFGLRVTEVAEPVRRLESIRCVW
jgi:flagellar motor switch protein FliN